MRRFHLLTGILMVLAFLATGQFMEHHNPPLDSLSDATRLLYRSRHIYILASGLVNLMLGLYLHSAPGPRQAGRTIGSGLILLSAPLLVAAFSTESARSFQAGPARERLVKG